MIPVHPCERETSYESTTKRPRGLHDHHRGTDPDPDRICSCREGTRGPPAGTKRPGHARGCYYFRPPRRDSHSPVSRFRFRQPHEPLHNQTWQRSAEQSPPLYNTEYLLCHAMADAIAASHDYRIPVTGRFCPASEPAPEVWSE